MITIIVTDIIDRFEIMQNSDVSSFMSCKYQFLLSNIFPVMEIKPSNPLVNNSHPDEPLDHSDSDDNCWQTRNPPVSSDCDSDLENTDIGSKSETAVDSDEDSSPTPIPVRQCREPAWL